MDLFEQASREDRGRAAKHRIADRHLRILFSQEDPTKRRAFPGCHSTPSRIGGFVGVRALKPSIWHLRGVGGAAALATKKD